MGPKPRSRPIVIKASRPASQEVKAQPCPKTQASPGAASERHCIVNVKADSGGWSKGDTDSYSWRHLHRRHGRSKQRRTCGDRAGSVGMPHPGADGKHWVEHAGERHLEETQIAGYTEPVSSECIRARQILPRYVLTVHTHFGAPRDCRGNLDEPSCIPQQSDADARGIDAIATGRGSQRSEKGFGCSALPWLIERRLALHDAAREGSQDHAERRDRKHATSAQQHGPSV